MKKILGILLVLAVLLCNVALADNLEDSKAMFDEAVATLMTTDNHPMLAPASPSTFRKPSAPRRSWSSWKTPTPTSGTTMSISTGTPPLTRPSRSLPRTARRASM